MSENSGGMNWAWFLVDFQGSKTAGRFSTGRPSWRAGSSKLSAAGGDGEHLLGSMSEAAVPEVTHTTKI